nr:MAG TPA: hypothetical protein [Caudoviricetes sp.]
MSDGIHIREGEPWEEPEKPGKTLRTATRLDRHRRRRRGRLRTGSAGERWEGRGRPPRVSEPVPIARGPSTYRRRRAASILDNSEGEAHDDRRSRARRPAAKYRGKVEACMPS